MSESRREFLANMTAAGLSKELLDNTEDREAGAQDNKKQKQETEQNEDLEIEIRDLKEDIESFAETSSFTTLRIFPSRVASNRSRRRFSMSQNSKPQVGSSKKLKMM